MAHLIGKAHGFAEVTSSLYADPENGLPACSICGAPLYPQDQLRNGPEWKQWTGNATLLTDESLDFQEISLESLPRSLLFKERDIARIQAEPLPRTFFRLKETEAKDEIVSGNGDDGYFHACLFITAHTSCVALADRFVASGPTAPAPMVGKWSMSKIWDILRLHLEASGCRGSFGTEQIEHPQDFFVPDFGPSFQWPDVDSLHDPLAPMGEAPSLLSHLGMINDDTPPEAVRFQQKLNQLPKELLDTIVNHICPLQQLPLHCTRLLAPSHWRDRLLNGKMLPWLWDLDRAATENYENERSNLDWERFVRELSQQDAFEDGKTFGDVSRSLWNRRRIWRVLETMYAGDLRIGDPPEEGGPPATILSIDRPEEDSEDDVDK